MSAPGTTSLQSSLLSSAATLVTALTAGLSTAYHAVITTVATWSLSELLKLGAAAAVQINASLKHFIAKLQSGVSWGSAMSSLLTEVWNGVKSDLQQFASDFVEAVGKLLDSAGLISVEATA